MDTNGLNSERTQPVCNAAQGLAKTTVFSCSPVALPLSCGPPVGRTASTFVPATRRLSGVARRDRQTAPLVWVVRLHSV
jgi:hypothetical protein